MDNNKLKLSLMLLMITVPIGLATIAFHYSESFSGFGNTSEGHLLNPVVDITALQLTDADNKPAYESFEAIAARVKPEDYKPRPWQVLYIGGASCDESCQQRLYFLRQLHTRLAKEASRVERVYVLTGDAEAALDATAQQWLQQAEMRVVHGSADTLAAVLKSKAAGEPINEHYLYVMDPVGNIMLYFTPEQGPDAIFKDLKKLLASSGLG